MLSVTPSMREIAIKAGMEENIHWFNMQSMLNTLPYDIVQNILSCTNAWVTGHSADGYPHPLSVISTYLYRNQFDHNLDAQQHLNMVILKNETSLFFDDFNVR